MIARGWLLRERLLRLLGRLTWFGSTELVATTGEVGDLWLTDCCGEVFPCEFGLPLLVLMLLVVSLFEPIPTRFRKDMMDGFC